MYIHDVIRLYKCLGPRGCFGLVTNWVWQVDSVQVFTFLFDHRLNRLDGRIYSVVLVVSPLVALMINQVSIKPVY